MSVSSLIFKRKVLAKGHFIGEMHPKNLLGNIWQSSDVFRS